MLGLSEGTSYCLAVVSLCRNGAHKGLVEGIFAALNICGVRSIGQNREVVIAGDCLWAN